MYTNLSPSLRKHQEEINMEFTMNCLRIMETIGKNELIVRNPKSKKDALRFISLMMTNFFEVTEENGMGNIMLHK